MRIYIAGPMRGIPSFNFPAFYAAEEALQKLGHETINPARLDREDGFDEDRDWSDEQMQQMMRAFMKRDLTAICDCDAIALLAGWARSAGVKVELSLANLLELPLYTINHDGQLQHLGSTEEQCASA